MFPSASGIMIRGGTFISQTNRTSRGMDLLMEWVATGAFHNSDELYDVPKYHPRVAVLDGIMRWVGESESARDDFMLWLYGPAGTGKSAIAKKIAEMAADKDLLIATFFFSKTSPTRNTKDRLIATLAYQLALSISETRTYIEDAIERDPIIFKKNIQTQIDTLLIKPFQSVLAQIVPFPKLIIIDGLDECNDSQAQIAILDAISCSFSKHNLPIIFLVISRPEFALVTSFNSNEPLSSIHSRLLLDDTYEPDDDIRLFSDKFEYISHSMLQTRRGFMADTSTSSPFASVKGQNTFMSGKTTPSPPPFYGSPASAETFSNFNSTPGQSSTTTSTVVQLSGFEAFASTVSPFAAVAPTKPPILESPSTLGQAKPPPHRTTATLISNPFTSYAGPVHSFAILASKRAGAGSPDGSSRSSMEKNSIVSAFGGSADGDCQALSFGERLRAAKNDEHETFDEEPKVQLFEQDVITGEEDENTIYSVQARLFRLDDYSWKEKGTGLLKLNVKREDGTGARLVMRRDVVYKVILNVALFSGMRYSLAQDPRYLRIGAIENGVVMIYNIKVSNARIARHLMEKINSNIPP